MISPKYAHISLRHHSEYMCTSSCLIYAIPMISSSETNLILTGKSNDRYCSALNIYIYIYLHIYIHDRIYPTHNLRYPQTHNLRYPHPWRHIYHTISPWYPQFKKKKKMLPTFPLSLGLASGPTFHYPIMICPWYGGFHGHEGTPNRIQVVSNEKSMKTWMMTQWWLGVPPQ